MAEPKVLVVNGFNEYHTMFLNAGWKITQLMSEADLIQFTGGEDVTPGMYGERKHPTTICNPFRDRYEAAMFEAAVRKEIPMAGICRGGQFLNVMNGGSMWQHVDKHCIGHLHLAYDFITGSDVDVSSTHHQMMRPSLEAELILSARIASKKERMGSRGMIVSQSDEVDTEACFYKKTKSLCFQPHPEFPRPDLEPCRTVYFYYLEHFFGLRGKGDTVCVG